ncbi:MFS transporter [Sulfitobacter albidus]|uniref:MFS transporter n=1 Tax=Sulfitobacter albidus TaxID=2829501 RepID=A0A975JEJ2_9RHOB|nr:MFS transporter [Sulfitobacter albidus]QUJ76590.1 MFS transporter [Sulfitobacter albidus]
MDPNRTIAALPWFYFLNGMLFWQATWFLYFQGTLSGAEAIALYAVYDIATTLIEVPSGVFSDRIGRRFTLALSALCGALGCLALATGDSFAVFALGQALIGASTAFRSGTDTSLLYESLDAAGRTQEVEAQEIRVQRFSFTGFALSAVIGGALAQIAPTLPFYATALAFLAALALTLRLSEPPRSRTTTARADLRALTGALTHPVLAWLFALGVLMYGFSHLPFVFGQPFIRETLDTIGLAGEAPLVSGAITAVMMAISVAVSFVALPLRIRLGLPLTLLAAFALQLALNATLSLTTATLAIAVLALRMVPDALANPFILARIQPLLPAQTRATYLSLKSLAGKLVFAATLMAASTTAESTGLLPTADLQRILGWYTLAGIACLATLAILARPLPLERGPEAPEQ